jgi:hypothetical protein
MNSKDMEESRGTIPVFAWRAKENLKNPWVARDETEEHPNTKHACYSVVTFDAVD